MIGLQTSEVRGHVDELRPDQDSRALAVAKALAMPTSLNGDANLWHHDHACVGCGLTLLARLTAQGLVIYIPTPPPHNEDDAAIQEVAPTRENAP